MFSGSSRREKRPCGKTTHAFINSPIFHVQKICLFDCILSDDVVKSFFKRTKLGPADSYVLLQNEPALSPLRQFPPAAQINMTVISQDTFQELQGLMSRLWKIMIGVLITCRLPVNTVYAWMGVWELSIRLTAVFAQWDYLAKCWRSKKKTNNKIGIFRAGSGFNLAVFAHSCLMIFFCFTIIKKKEEMH